MGRNNGVMQVLVVDDEAPVREALRRALTLEGYSVELAADGAEALHRLRDEGAADAVVLDVLMPGVDGLEVCRRIRSAGNGIPVLMLTARDEIADRVAGLDAGADDYLVKPFALKSYSPACARCFAVRRRTPTTSFGSPTSGSTRRRGRSPARASRSSSRAPSSRCSSSSCGIRSRC